MHDGVAVATAGAAEAAAVAGTAVVEVVTGAPVVPAILKVDPKGAVEATTAPVAVRVAAAEEYAPRPLLAPQAARPQERGVHHEGERFRA